MWGVRLANRVSECRADFVAQIEFMLAGLSSSGSWCIIKCELWTCHAVSVRNLKRSIIVEALTLDHVSFGQKSNFHTHLL
jgi:hypothetical protein